jgi:1-deoxy-D-xylulose-5-phosphate reductoisomerase
VFALTANKNVDALFSQCLKFSPQYAVMLEDEAAEQLSIRLKEAGSATRSDEVV